MSSTPPSLSPSAWPPSAGGTRRTQGSFTQPTGTRSATPLKRRLRASRKDLSPAPRGAEQAPVKRNGKYWKSLCAEKDEQQPVKLDVKRSKAKKIEGSEDQIEGSEDQKLQFLYFIDTKNTLHHTSSKNVRCMCFRPLPRR